MTIPQNKFIHIQTISCLFIYDARLAFEVMNKHNYTSGFFEIWFDRIGQARYDIEIKRMIVGIANIISCPFDSVPDFCRDGMADILH